MAIALAAMLAAGPAFAEKKNTKNVKSEEKSAWLTDLDKATAAAQKAKLPIFVNFSGSDWCGSCKLVEKEVFSKPEWNLFAMNKFILAIIDSPQDETLLPKKTREKNQKLVEQFRVEGFPTFIILDSTGTNEIKRFGLSQSPELFAFMREAGAALRDLPEERKKIEDSLPEDQRGKYSALLTDIGKLEAEVQAWLRSKPAQTEENLAKLEQYGKKMTELARSIDELEMSQLIAMYSANEQAIEQNRKTFRSARAYVEKLAELYKAEMTLENWVLARPAPGPATTGIYDKLRGDVEKSLKELEDAGK